MTHKTAFIAGVLLATALGPRLEHIAREQMWAKYRVDNPYNRELKTIDAMWQRDRLLGVGPEMTCYRYNPGAACLGVGPLVDIWVYGPQKREIMDRLEETIEANRLFEGPLK